MSLREQDRWKVSQDDVPDGLMLSRASEGLRLSPRKLGGLKRR